MKITANKKKQSFEPIELTVVIESEEEMEALKIWYLDITADDINPDRGILTLGQRLAIIDMVDGVYKAAKEAKE